MPADPIALARELLRCPSVTPKEGGALSLLDKLLSGVGFTVHRISFSEPGDDDVENLYARIGAAGPHLMFAGHTDVVPPGDEARWRHPPFAGEIADGVLFRRGSLNGTLIVTGTAGHVAYPALADNPVRRIVAIMAAVMAEPLDAGSAHFDPSNLEFTSVDVGNKTVNVIPPEARGRFNIRFNDRHTQGSLKALIEARAHAAAQGGHFRIAWEPSNADVFVTKPGPFVDMVSDAIAEVTGRRPELSTSGGTSDARFIKDYCPVVEFGLVNATMHKIDECVATADLVALTAVYRRILDRYFNNPP